MHSPFEIIEDFISPLQCSVLLDNLALKKPDLDLNGAPIKYESIFTKQHLGVINNNLNDNMERIVHRYKSEVSNFTIVFQQYPENPNAPAEGIHCGNSIYSRKKWTKVKDVDLVGILWLKNYNNKIPLDTREDVYGGKLEFPGYNFSFAPQAGTLVIFPAGPEFVTAISHIMVGSLEQIKFNIKLKNWKFNIGNFQGSYKEWFFS